MITVTDTASKKIKRLLTQRGRGVGIRLGVKTTGCSGLAYTLEYVDSYTPEEGVTNYAQLNGLNEGFEFRNPNERDKCGCGESFRV